MLDEGRWRRLWQRLGGGGDPALTFAGVGAAFAEPHPAHHKAAHVADCLQQLDAARALAARPDEVEAALWFHDAVYDPRAADNEERSEAWVARALAGAGADVVGRVAALVLATKHDREPDGPDAALLV